jgi:hypothetical protein
MTQAQLDKIMELAENGEISITEIGKICGALLESNSRHFKEIKSKMKSLEEQLSSVEEKLDMIIENQSPAFGIIDEDDEED